MCITEYDLDAHMKATYEEGRSDGWNNGWNEGKSEEQENGIKILITTNKKYHISRKNTKRALMEGYSLKKGEADKYLELYW